MADDEIDVVEPEAKGKKKLILGIIGLLVVAGISVGAYLFLAGGDDSVDTPSEIADPGDISRAVQEDGVGPQAGDAIYVGMPRPFVFNVPGEERDRLVQIKVQLLVRGSNNEELAKRHIPLIEGTLLQAFSSMTADELQTAEGKDRIRALGRDKVREVLAEVAGRPVVDEVLFNGFVLQ